MNATADRLEFAPPPTPGLLRAIGLAIIAHGFLVAALTWGVQWKQSPDTISADKSVKYESVVRVMDTLQRAGVRRVGLSVKQGAS